MNSSSPTFPTSTGELLELIPALAQARVLVVGDVMLDQYVRGTVERISPEAPVPVVRVDEEWALLGGAGNVARNVAALGAVPRLVGVRGFDSAGDVLARILSREGIDHELIVDAQRPTTCKTRILAHNQQVVRVDREASAPISGVTLARFNQAVGQAVTQGLAGDGEGTPGAVIVSDYGKGAVQPGLMQVLAAATASAGISAGGGPRPLVLLDPKPVNAALYQGLDVLTPNLKEAGELLGRTIDCGPSDQGRQGGQDGQKADLGGLPTDGRELLAKLGAGRLLVTLGGRGMALFERGGPAWLVPTTAQNVFDVTGAGDTVIGALAAALAVGVPPLSACLLANYAAGVTVSRVGAAVVSPEDLARAVREHPAPEIMEI